MTHVAAAKSQCQRDLLLHCDWLVHRIVSPKQLDRRGRNPAKDTLYKLNSQADFLAIFCPCLQIYSITTWDMPFSSSRKTCTHNMLCPRRARLADRSRWLSYCKYERASMAQCGPHMSASYTALSSATRWSKLATGLLLLFSYVNYFSLTYRHSGSPLWPLFYRLQASRTSEHSNLCLHCK